MKLFIDTFLLTFAALFPIVSPIAGAPVFLGLTQFASDKHRNELALAVALNSFFLLLGALFVGSHVLAFFGISLPIVRVAGGLVLAAFGWKLLNSDERPDGNRDPKSTTAAVPDAFYPLTMPLTVGPGSISVAITLGSQRRTTDDLAYLLQAGAAAVLGILAIALSIFLCYRFAERTVAMLGRSGTNVVVRLSAFIELCIGIQILWDGWSALAH
ncbi:MAG: NAAT family transporter [Alphaproteobacteria bacterium]|nr:NAAT family transporter [Alphaproteobacteria bacterium]MBV9693580.1 NAAT family transporter [Alphaproteobacteria bacterium]